MGHTDSLSERSSSKDQLIDDPRSELDDDDEVADCSEEILYGASFEELAQNYIQYDAIIWVSISLLLVLAWGVGIVMLLYFPYKRYVLRKDISSRKLYVTPTEIVYKSSRPSFIPFWGFITIEKHVPLSEVLDIITEQGCLQSKYGIHTLRIESISRGGAAPVDELQVQGVSNPQILRKVIIGEASKSMQDVGKGWRPTTLVGEEDTTGRIGSLNEGPVILRSPSKSLKMTGSPRYPSVERRSILSGELFLNRLEEMNRSVKKIEFIVEKSRATPKVDE